MATAPLTGAVFVPADPPRRGHLALLGGGVDSLEVVLAPTDRSGPRRATVPVRMVPIAEAVELLTAPAGDTSFDISPTVGSLDVWREAALAGLQLVARGRLLPSATPSGHDSWRIGPLDPDDARWLAAFAAAVPAAAHALPVPGSRPVRLRSAAVLVRAFWDAIADTLARSPAAATVVGHDPFAAEVVQPVGRLAHWLEEVASAADPAVATGLRIALPDDGDEATGFTGVLQLRSTADPSLVVDAADLWDAPDVVLARLGDDAEQDLAMALRRGARVFPPLGTALAQAAPTSVPLDDEAVAALLAEAAAALGGAGIEVLWPSDLFSDSGSVRLRASATKTPGAVVRSGLGLPDLLDFQWQASLGGEQLTEEEVAALAEAKRPLVRMRGRWVVADPALVQRLRQRKPPALATMDALRAALTGTLEVDGEPVEFIAGGALADLADRLRSAAATPQEMAEPAALQAELRAYQRRGLAWLAMMCDLGLGGCLADDMGLGKTIQVIALHLHRTRPGAEQPGPTLVVCPTSLLGNWQRELARFAPSVQVRRFHGDERDLGGVPPSGVVLTTYGVVRRDRAALAEVAWGTVVADEAQAAKNPLSRTARELRALPAGARVALSGTPVENRLSELWSVLDWTTPGLLGTLSEFRREVAVPIERHHDPDATQRLARTVSAFLLRRRKSDPGIAPELPPKTETDRVVPLTAEQATLYQAVVAETLEQIASSEGMERRGLVLKLLTALKQVCNHPAQYLGQAGPLTGRSGKLEALEDLLDVIVEEGESALVFTQYLAMGTLLSGHLESRGVQSLFLHGGVPVRRREEMVRRYTDGEVPVFLLSLKAGGTGLNLTRASHVVHYDRWWNPAVEAQATDRAYRIGQDKPVQVHRLVTEGTVEDRIAELLETKKALADSVLGGGESWLTELDDAQLADLVRLR